MFFFGGIFVGIFIFAEAYPMIRHFYMSGYLGAPKVYEIIGISGGVFALLVILAAALMFWGGEWAEKKFPREKY